MSQKKTNKDYSVLMSVYHKENPRFFRESIKSMLSQSVLPLDFVIVCDGPLGDELENVIDEVCRPYGRLFQIIRLPKCGGLGNALNEGLKFCRKEYVARMDSDDISRSMRCERQLEVLEEKQVDIVGGALWEFEKEPAKLLAQRVSPETQEEILEYMKRRNPFNHPCVMYRKSAVEAAGGYRHCPYFEDYDLWIRMLLNGSKGYNLQEPILYMRAGDSMYARRGGLLYGFRALKFRWSLKQQGVSDWSDFLVSGLGQFFISLLPNGLRRSFYNKALRREV